MSTEIPMIRDPRTKEVTDLYDLEEFVKEKWDHELSDQWADGYETGEDNVSDWSEEKLTPEMLDSLVKQALRDAQRHLERASYQLGWVAGFQLQAERRREGR